MTPLIQSTDAYYSSIIYNQIVTINKAFLEGK
jgi:hypothetical protein